MEVGAPKDQARNDGTTPLSIAAHQGHLDVVSHLVDARQNEATRDTGATALHAAAESCHAEIFRFLIERGADSHATTRCGRTALDLASQSGHSEAVRSWQRFGANHPQAKSQGLGERHPVRAKEFQQPAHLGGY